MERRRRVVGTAVLLGCSVVYLGVKVLETLITYPATWSLTWRQWLNMGGVLILLIWYALFVLLAKERQWFGAWRRVVTAGVLCAIAAGAAWWGSVSPGELAAWAAGGLVGGYLAEYWVEGF